MRRGLVGVIGAVLCTVGPTSAHAGDMGLLRAAQSAPTVWTTAAGARAWSPHSVQRAYNSARSMRERVRRAGATSARCDPLRVWAVRFSDAATQVAEGYDRLSAWRVRAARRALARARVGFIRARRQCRPGGSVRALIPGLRAPRSGAAFFGDVVVPFPSGADQALLLVDGRRVGLMHLGSDGVARFHMAGPVGRHTLDVRFRRQGRGVARAVSQKVWLLPQSGADPVRAATNDPLLVARLRRAASGFDGIAGIWVHHLTTGRAAEWNSGARFPAASLVKLGVMIGALQGTGNRPEYSPRARDVAAIGGWSSNLAPNRLMPAVGGGPGVERVLRRMGVSSSTYPGAYIVATEAPVATTVRQPALTTRRVTTAADMGRALTVIHRAALGHRGSLAATGLNRAQARFVLGTLLASQPVTDNRGILRQAVPRAVPMAQKHGWISRNRHSAAILYTPSGPVVVVVLTHRQGGMPRIQAAALGSAVVRALS